MACFCFFFFMPLVRLFSWIDDFLSVIVKESVWSLILQSLDRLLGWMFSGLLLLSDASEIIVLVQAVLLHLFKFNSLFCFFLFYLKLVFQLLCHSLCFDHFVVVFFIILRYTGHCIFISEYSFNDLCCLKCDIAALLYFSSI